MLTKMIKLNNGANLVVPINYEPPGLNVEDFPSSCGPGTGITEFCIPETFFGLRISPACHIHDASWDVAEGTWADFHQSNYMFMHNLLSLITAGSNKFTEFLRVYRAATYFNMVDTFGSSIFKSYKKTIWKDSEKER